MAVSNVQIKHIQRNILQRLAKVRVGVIVGYHGGNLGDMALGIAVLNILKEKGLRSGLQTIYNLDKWPQAPYAIVGGGAVGYIDSLLKIAQRYKSEYNKIGFLGVDFNEKEYPHTCVELLKEASFLSCRSEVQAVKMSQITGRTDVSFHPDIAFSINSSYCHEQRLTPIGNRKKRLLVNVVPLYAHIENRVIKPVERYKSERPELYQSFNTMHQSYKLIVRAAVEKALQEGLEVETIPFTPTDEAYGRIILDGLPVKHAKYHDDPIRMLKNMNHAQIAVTTRYHATIFALKAGIPFLPIAYARKNELMLQELGFLRKTFLSTDDLANGMTELLSALHADPSMIQAWEDAAIQSINRCIDTLNVRPA